MRFLALPSPSQGVWYLGPIPIRAYGLIIACAILIAVYWAARRYEVRGGDRELFYDIALWAVPGGIVGARIYHVITSPDAYFGKNGNPIMALAIWNGGLGIWGAVAGGALAAWLVVRHRGQRLGPVADSLAIPLLAAQAIGRWGNWFNQELFGAPTTLPWGLRIDGAHMPLGYASGTLFHPTFLYESLWNLVGVAVLLFIDKRRSMKSGQLFSCYIMVYTLGRVWIEMLRIDDAHHFLGLRINVWTSILVFILGVVCYLYAGKRAASTTLAEVEIMRESGLDEEDDAQTLETAEASENTVEDGADGNVDGADSPKASVSRPVEDLEAR